MNLRERAKKLKINIPTMFIVMRKKETPVIAKIITGFIVVYTLSPIDLIPDFIPVLGYLDDIILLPAMVALAIRIISPEILAESKKEAEGLWINGKTQKWYYALPIVLLWLIMAYLTVKIIFF